MTVRYNSFLGALRLDPEVGGPNVVTGNIGPSSGCQPNASYSYNVWSGAKCAASDRTAPLTNVFVDPSSAGFGLQLKAGSPAIGAGDPRSFPPRDIAGRIRPVTFPADSGAWQREPALVVPGRSIGTATLQSRRAEIVGFYGTPRKRTRETLPDGTRLAIEEHRVRGGSMRITYRDETVVAIATTSTFYRTAKGLSPGSPLQARRDDDWRCRPVGAPVRKARFYVRPTRSKKPVVAELIVTRRGFAPTCATPKSAG